MKILWVRAHPFGPHVDDRLDFGPGLTVVSGANETGKSSWHAATTTALTGRRKGKARKADERYAAQSSRYKPWTGDTWAVSCAVETDSGRVVRITHDLASGVSQAIDDVTGVDLSADLMHDRGLDASTLAGLNRQILPLVASVGQAEILELAVAQGRDASVGVLRSLLQQSVSSRSESDSSAEQAITRLTAQKQAIGTTRKGSSKPLRQAMDAVEAADAAVDRARDQWERHRQNEAARAAAEQRTAKLAKRIGQLELAEAERRTHRLTDRLSLALDFRATVDEFDDDDTAVSAGSSSTAELVAQARAALVTVENRPGLSPSPERSSDDVLADLESIPLAPDGPTSPTPEFVDRVDELRAVQQATAAMNRRQPEVRVLPADVAGFTADELRDAADGFARRVALRNQPVATVPTPQPERSPMWATVAGVVAGLLAIIGGIAVGQWLAVVLGVVVAAGSVALGWSQHRRRAQLPVGSVGATSESGAPESISPVLSPLEERVRAAGLSVNPSDLRSTATAVERHEAEHRGWSAWAEERDALAAQTTQAAGSLHQLLRTCEGNIGEGNGGEGNRGEGNGGERNGGEGSGAEGAALDDALSTPHLLARADQWVGACAQRRRELMASQSRQPLMRELHAVRATEAAVEETARRRRAAVADLEAAAAVVGLSATFPVELQRTEADIQRLSEALRAWCDQADSTRESIARVAEARRSLSQLLEGRTLDELKQAVAERDAARKALASAFGPVPASWADRSAQQITARRQQLERELVAERTTADQLRGALEEETGHLTSLAELREEQARAHRDHDRLHAQLATIDTTIDLLVKARREVHRDVAPVLARLTEDRLARVTAGRYKQLRVNPEDLSVQVQQAGGMWMPAEQLSHGTAEQIYLLLRVAIAEVVSPGSESCPLLLDDVTVHADDERTAAMLDVIHELSRDRQVVLFSQESAVRQWAGDLGAKVIILPSV